MKRSGKPEAGESNVVEARGRLCEEEEQEEAVTQAQVPPGDPGSRALFGMCQHLEVNSGHRWHLETATNNK